MMKKKELPRLDVQNKTTKRRLCVGIANFMSGRTSVCSHCYHCKPCIHVCWRRWRKTNRSSQKEADPEGANAQLTKAGSVAAVLTLFSMGKIIRSKMVVILS